MIYNQAGIESGGEGFLLSRLMVKSILYLSIGDLDN